MDTRNPDELGKKVVEDIQKDFKVVGTNRIHSLGTWISAGLILGALVAVAYVANKQGKFIPTLAAYCPAMPGPFTYHGFGQKTAVMSTEEFNIYLISHSGVMNGLTDEQQAKVSDVSAKVDSAKLAAKEACKKNLVEQQVKYSDLCATGIQVCGDFPECTSGAVIPPDADSCEAAQCSQSSNTLDCTSTSPSETISCSCTAKNVTTSQTIRQAQQEREENRFQEPELPSAPPVPVPPPSDL